MEIKGYSVQNMCPAPPNLILETRDDESELVEYKIISLVTATKGSYTKVFPVILLNGELTIFDTDEYEEETEVRFDE